MKKISRILLIMVLVLSAMTSKAQNDGMSLTLLPNTSYSNMYNPAIPIEYRFVAGAVFSNIGFSIYNSSVRYHNLYNFSDGVPVAFNANQFINSLEEHDNYINSNFSMDILRLGLGFGKFFADFSWSYKYNGELHYSKDFLGFFVNGNGNYLGANNPADFSIGTDINMYSELALGLRYEINDKLSVGIRPKFLYGGANLSINDDGTKIYTDENTYEMTADVNINIVAATALDMGGIYRISDFTNYFDNMDTIVLGEMFDAYENLGFGIDFGASYTFNEHIGVAAGVYDLGYIRWKDSKVKHIHKDNVVVNDALIDDFEDLLDMNIDFSEMYSSMMEDVWDNDSIYDGGDYKTTLKTKIMLQGYYEFSPLARITAIGQMYYARDKFHPALTLAYSGSLYRFLNLSASYTMSKYSGNSLGLGLGVKIAGLNVFVVTDNIMIVSKFNAPVMEMLTSYNSANIRFGMLLTLGNKNKNKNKDIE